MCFVPATRAPSHLARWLSGRALHTLPSVQRPCGLLRPRLGQRLGTASPGEPAAVLPERPALAWRGGPALGGSSWTACGRAGGPALVPASPSLAVLRVCRLHPEPGTTDRTAGHVLSRPCPWSVRPQASPRTVGTARSRRRPGPVLPRAQAHRPPRQSPVGPGARGARLASRETPAWGAAGAPARLARAACPPLACAGRHACVSRASFPARGSPFLFLSDGFEPQKNFASRPRTACSTVRAPGCRRRGRHGLGSDLSRTGFRARCRRLSPPNCSGITVENRLAR